MTTTFVQSAWAPSSTSLTDTLKVNGWPSSRGVPSAGDRIFTTGRVLPTVTGKFWIDDAPWLSVTVRRATNSPAVGYVWLTLAPVASAVPSFVQSQL